MIYTNTYIENKPKKLLRLTVLLYLFFTVTFVWVLFLYRTEQKIDLSCRFFDVIQPDLTTHSVFAKMTGFHLQKYETKKNGPFDVRFLSLGPQAVRGCIYFDKRNTAGVSGDTFQVMICIDRPELILKQSVSGIVSLTSDRKISLFEQLTN